MRAVAPALALATVLALATAGCGALLARPEGERAAARRQEAFFTPSTGEPAALFVGVESAPGRRPSLEALQALVGRLRERTGRAVGLLLAGEPGGAQPAPATLLDLHVVYEARDPGGLRGFCAGREIRIFRDQVASHAILWIGPDTIERTVLVHEAGHALGLGHCTRPDCVMYKPRGGEVWDWRMALANLAPALFLGRIPDDFCPLCRRDLEGSPESTTDSPDH